MQLLENELQAIHALKERIAERFEVIEFRLFGSKARGASIL